MSRKSSYKPLLFTTTMRSPERLKGFLGVLKDYDGKFLDDSLAQEIAGEIIRIGLYKPSILPATARTKISQGIPLSDGEVTDALRDNPQNHKEAGFTKGWPSRFDTWFKLAKEFGFVFFRPNEKIRFSDVGVKLVDVGDASAEFEQQAFLNAFVKYQRNNPFRRVLNENAPLILLLQVIRKLNADSSYNNTGISKMELPLVIYWKDNDSEKLYERIKILRAEFGYTPSWETIIGICRNEIMQGTDIVRNAFSITMDYPDEFIRKMRLTGLISLRGGGRFIDININEQKKINYILKNYATYEKYDTEESYFEYISTVDKNLISTVSKSIPISKKREFLEKWVDVYVWDKIKSEMLILSHKNLSRDEILKYLSGPVRLEFLTALAVKSKFPNVVVTPNYPIDDEGIPTSTAGGVGNTGDIECLEGLNGILLEVTMSEGGMQTKMEIWPISRHLEEFQQTAKNSICYFVAPSIFSDSIKQIGYLKHEYNLLVFPKTIKDFLQFLENNDYLYPQ